MSKPLDHDVWTVLFQIEKRYIDREFEGRKPPQLLGGVPGAADQMEHLIDAAAVIVAWVLQQDQDARNGSQQEPSDGPHLH